MSHVKQAAFIEVQILNINNKDYKFKSSKKLNAYAVDVNELKSWFGSSSCTVAIAGSDDFWATADEFHIYVAEEAKKQGKTKDEIYTAIALNNDLVNKQNSKEYIKQTANYKLFIMPFLMPALTGQVFLNDTKSCPTVQFQVIDPATWSSVLLVARITKSATANDKSCLFYNITDKTVVSFTEY